MAGVTWRWPRQQVLRVLARLNLPARAAAT